MRKKGSGSKTGKMTPELIKSFLSEAWDGEPIIRKVDRYPVCYNELLKIRRGEHWQQYQTSVETSQVLRGRV